MGRGGLVSLILSLVPASSFFRLQLAPSKGEAHRKMRACRGDALWRQRGGFYSFGLKFRKFIWIYRTHRGIFKNEIVGGIFVRILCVFFFPRMNVKKYGI